MPNILTKTLRNLFIISIFAALAVSCSSVKPASTNTRSTGNAENKSSITFIENISVTPGTSKEEKSVSVVPVKNKENSKISADPGSIENYSPLQFKYAILTNSSVEQMRNQKLLDFMDEWYGTRYHYGGTTKDGIDCSAFVSLLMSNVYGISNLPRIAKDQYNGSHHIQRNDLQEGDLVFFHTMGKHKSVSHVGVYLCNNKFVHASVSGVMISDMEEGYYSQHYVGAGRVRD
jgi:lipoprotein Spr